MRVLGLPAALMALGFAAVFILSGCVVPTGPGPAAATPAPFRYEPLNVRNSCFVESVHFYDEYLQKRRGGDATWSRILQWGNREGDFKLSDGHAVTVFVAQEKLWLYDVNFGFSTVPVPLDRRADITDVTPKVFGRYPQFRPVFARYNDDFPQQPAKPRITYLFYHANPDVRDATHVASELGRFRPVSVIEFDLTDNGQKVTSAATVFTFGRQLCIYCPRKGTHQSPKFLGAPGDLKYISFVVKRIFPGAENVRWQPGGYLLFPNEKPRPDASK